MPPPSNWRASQPYGVWTQVHQAPLAKMLSTTLRTPQQDYTKAHNLLGNSIGRRTSVEEFEDSGSSSK